MPKLIREIRMGPPKAWKTGAVVSSYPKPMLVFEGDDGGLDVIQQPITWVKPTEFPTFLDTVKKTPTYLPPITAIQFSKNEGIQLNENFAPLPDKDSFIQFNGAANAVFKYCPFKTVVLDPITKLSEIILSAYAQKNVSKMDDARKWASAVGQRTQQTIAAFFTLPCHVVCLMHTALETKRDNNGNILETFMEPVIYSKLRNMLGSLPSQFFYQDSIVVAAKRETYILTVPDGRVRGIGARWPTGLAPKISDPTFDNIYGEAVKKGETTK